MYAAFLGIQPTISIAELSAVLPDCTAFDSIGPSIVGFDTKESIDQQFLQSLGGTILLAKRIINTNELSVTLNDIPGLLKTELKDVRGKATFALRFIGVSPREGRELYKTCKDALKQSGVSSRYIGNERDPAKPIQLHDEGLLNPKEGCELTIIRTPKNLWIGRTVAAQNVKAYTMRDMQKPVRDTTVGLLPPKLAQILLNLGSFLVGKKDGTVFDPFCGTGVILLEALLRKQSVLGSDLSQKAVNGSEKNIEWARKTFKILKKDADSLLWKQDARKPFELKEQPSVIVTEGTLGPPLLARPNIREAERLAKDALDTTLLFLKNCAACIPHTPIVMTLPVWYSQKRMIYLPNIHEAFEKIGYTTVLPPLANANTDGRCSLLYRRADQVVGREIVLLKPISRL